MPDKPLSPANKKVKKVSLIERFNSSLATFYRFEVKEKFFSLNNVAWLHESSIDGRHI